MTGWWGACVSTATARRTSSTATLECTKGTRWGLFFSRWPSTTGLRHDIHIFAYADWGR